MDQEQLREKYLRKLLELTRELDAEYRNNSLDMWSNDLRSVMHYVLIAFWFYQIDELWGHLLFWKLQPTHAFVFQDVEQMTQDFLASKLAEQAAAEMAAEAKAAQTPE